LWVWRSDVRNKIRLPAGAANQEEAVKALAGKLRVAASSRRPSR
jgi:hypothetical protein